MSVLREGDLVQRIVMYPPNRSSATGIIIISPSHGVALVMWPCGNHEWVWKDNLVKKEGEEAWV